MNRRGQLTLFLIILAVLVIAAGVATYLYVNSGPSNEPTNTAIVTSRPAQTFIERCLQSAGNEVFKNLGEHGGYYKPEDTGSFAAVTDFPTAGNALQPFARTIVPYWRYLASPDTCTHCTLGSERPPLEGNRFPAVQAQAEKAITERFTACIDNFKSLSGATVQVNGQPVVQVKFGEKDTTLALDYPVSITTGGGAPTAVHAFSTVVDIPFKRMYTTSVALLDATATQPVLEGMTMDLVTLASKETTVPPPDGGTAVTYDPPRIWTKTGVRDAITHELASSVPTLQVLAARNANLITSNDPTTRNQYDQYNIRIPELNSPFEVRFLYLPSWTPYLAVRPSRGEIIQPKVSRFPLGIFPSLVDSDFQYDLSYPVLVQLTAKRAGKDDYLFQFPIEVNIRNNNAVPYSLTLENTASPDFVCNPDTFAGALTSFEVTEAQSGNPLSADLSFACLDNECPLSRADSDGKLETRLPTCLEGKAYATVPGYKEGVVTIDTIGDRTAVSIALQKLTETHVGVAPYPLMKVPVGVGAFDWNLDTSAPITLDDTYQEIVTFTDVNDESYSQVIQLPSDRQVQLYPGDYVVSVIILKNLDAPKVIQGGDICGGGVLGIGQHCEHVDDITIGTPPSSLDPSVASLMHSVMPAGGAQYDADTHTVRITQDMLDQGTLVIPAVAINPDLIVDIHDMPQLGKIADYTKLLSTQ